MGKESISKNIYFYAIYELAVVLWSARVNCCISSSTSPTDKTILYSSSVSQNSSFSGFLPVSQETRRQSRQLQETMCSLEKIVGRQVENPVKSAGSIPISVPAYVPAKQEVSCSSLLFLRDILSDRDFLVNSGASVSVFPGPASTS